MPYDAEGWVAPQVDPRTLTEPRDRLVWLRDWLLQMDPRRFDMEHWRQPSQGCGSVMCIGGWAEAHFSIQASFDLADSYDQTAKALGLCAYEAALLFNPMGYMLDGTRALHCRDPRKAAAVITRYLETGVVDWSRV